MLSFFGAFREGMEVELAMISDRRFCDEPLKLNKLPQITFKVRPKFGKGQLDSKRIAIRSYMKYPIT